MSDVEAMRWHRAAHRTEQSAEQIVAWVNANGGEARYVPSRWDAEPALIAVLTRDGWAYCSPGQWVVKGDEWVGHVGEEFIGVREFTVADSRPGVSS